jgi:BirA family biotin operon repressor/biotin-[acetyl-CoA-carboxylase] ligase
MTRPDDHPAFPGWVIALPTCPSTNTWALDHLDALAHGACVWTPRQTAGRGRGASTWHAPPGVLTASFVLDLAGPDERGAVPAAQLSLAAGLAVANAVEDLVPAARIAIKWPNDVLLRERKLAGILCESRRRDDGRPAVVVGIGLNLAPRWDLAPAALPLAVSKVAPIGLDEFAPPPAEPVLLTALRRYLLEAWGLLAARGFAPLLPALRQRDWLAGRAVTVRDGERMLRGTAGGLDDRGALLVDGTVVASGTVVEV